MVHVPVARLALVAHDEILAYRHFKRNKQHDRVRFLLHHLDFSFHTAKSVTGAWRGPGLFSGLPVAGSVRGRALLKADGDGAADLALPRGVRLSRAFAGRAQQSAAAGLHDGL